MDDSRISDYLQGCLNPGHIVYFFSLKSTKKKLKCVYAVNHRK